MNKNVLVKLLLLALALAMTLCLFACNGDDTPDNGGNTDGDNTQGDGTQGDGTQGDGTQGGDGEDDGIDWDNTGLKGLALIYNSKARFQVVYATDAGSTAIREANAFVDKLRGYGVEVGDPVSDADASLVKDCEIIFGANVRNRPEGVTVTDKYLGSKGKTIKVVGNSIVVAGGSTTELKAAIGRFITNTLGIKSSTKKLDQLSVEADFFEESLTKYNISSIRIGKVDLKNYVIVEDLSEYTGIGSYFAEVRDFQEDLYAESGYWLEYVKPAEMDKYQYKIILKYTENTVEDGFTAYVDESGSLHIECAYANAFDMAYGAFMEQYILGKTGDVFVSASLNYKDDVAFAHYEDFGAKGDGTTDDFQAIYDTHVFANEGGQKVLGKEGAIYYIADIPKPIPVRTDADFGGATFRVNDVGSDAHAHRGNPLFDLVRDYSSVTYKKAQIQGMFDPSDLVIDYDTTELPWLAPYIEAKSLVVITNSNHRDFIRHGANQNSGSVRHDVFIVYPDGKIDEDSEVCFDFDEITQIDIHRVDDTPVTVCNGNFINICCKSVAETDFKNDYLSYLRGFRFSRANVTLYGINHKIEGEPDLDLTYDNKFGRRNEGYPYYGFINVGTCYNLTVRDSFLSGHTVYYEDKPATESTGGQVPDPVPMGSYDITVRDSIDVGFYNVIQHDPGTGIGDSRYWGIMATNWAKNLVFNDCELSRIDAHCGFWDVTAINTTIGHTINVIGGGDIYFENVTKLVGGTFIATRSDYGGSFRGNVTLVDCELVGANSYNSWRTLYNPSSKVATGYIINIGYKATNQNKFWEWDFGYPCHMPTNVVIDNFKGGTGKLYLFNSLPDEVFTKDNPLHITQSITYLNMDRVPVCPDSTAVMMNAIPLTMGKTDKES